MPCCALVEPCCWRVGVVCKVKACVVPRGEHLKVGRIKGGGRIKLDSVAAYAEVAVEVPFKRWLIKWSQISPEPIDHEPFNGNTGDGSFGTALEPGT